MQISPAISSDLRAISSASSEEFRNRAAAAACAYGPPLPMAAMPSSGSITSPVPESTNRCSTLPTMRSASSRRSARSWRQSLASSTAARVRSLYSPNLLSNFSSSVIPSAAEPANPARTLPPAIFRTLRAPCLTIVLSSVTCPSPAMASLPSRRTARIVVDRIFMLASLPRRRKESFSGPRFDRRKRAFRHAPPPLTFALFPTVSHRREVTPSDVGWLEIGGVVVLEVGNDRPERALSWKIDRLQPYHRSRGMDARHRSARRRFDIALRAGNLSGKIHRRRSSQLQARVEQTR